MIERALTFFLFVLLPAPLFADSQLPSPSLNLKAVHQQVQSNQASFLDIREEDEISGNGIPNGALWLPYSVALARREGWKAFVKRAPKDRPVYICASNSSHAQKIKAQLEADGFTHVKLVGTIKDWQAKGLPVIKFVQSGKPLDRGKR